VAPFVHGGSRVVVDGRPICAECGLGIEPVGPDQWRHAAPGAAPARSHWLTPGLADLRACATYAEFAATYPWAVRTDHGGVRASTESQWREAVARLERYEARLAELSRRTALAPGENPYAELVELLAAPPAQPSSPSEAPREARQPRYWGLPWGLAQLLDLSERRRELVDRFAWAIPGEAALEALVRYAPLVEVGAGTGYWLALLQARGVDAIGYDLAPPGDGAANAYHEQARLTWTDVPQGSAVSAARRHSDRNLVLCWPPFDDDAASYAALRAYRGAVAIHIGERDGASGSVRFHRELALNWTAVEEIELPHWPRVDDRLVVYWRNRVRRPATARDRCSECRRFVPVGWIGRCDACFEARPPALALRVGRHRVEYTREALEALPVPLRRAFEASAERVV